MNNPYERIAAEHAELKRLVRVAMKSIDSALRAIRKQMNGGTRLLPVYVCHDGAWQYAIAIKNIKDAAKRLGVSPNYIRQHGGRHDAGDTHRAANNLPGVIPRRKLDVTVVPREWETTIRQA